MFIFLKISCPEFVVVLLRNGSTYFYEIFFMSYLVGMNMS